MNRTWIVGLSMAAVAGSAGAAFASMSPPDQVQSAQAKGFEADLAAAVREPNAAAKSYNYQVGTAGTVSLTAAAGNLTVTGALPGTGWTVVTYSTPAAHVDVQFTDSLQIVTFGADLVGNEVIVALSNLPAPGADTTAVTTPMTVTEITSHKSGGASKPTSAATNSTAPHTWPSATPKPYTPKPTPKPTPITTERHDDAPDTTDHQEHDDD